jgi:dolichol-phosphate mannosyltransferase
MAGLAAARGRAVIMMDADLQHPPSVVPQLLRKWREGFQIVHAVRRDPANLSWFKRVTSKLYYRLFAFMSGVQIEPGSADFRLLDRQVVDEVLKFEEEGLFLRGLVHWVGYETASVPFDCGERHAGKTKYNLRKMLTLGWHGVSSFSLVPLRIGIAIGLLSSTLAFVGVAYAIVGWWLDKAVVPGWASSVAISSFLFGVLFVFLAVLAEYVGRIVVEVRRRPRFLVRETTRPTLAAADRRPQRRGADARAEG